VALDLKQSAAVEIVKRLVARADLVVENYRPGVMKRLGLDYESLAPIRSDLVYCALSGYGQSGPSSGLPAYAPVIHAASGYDLAHLSYQEGRTRPDNTVSSSPRCSPAPPPSAPPWPRSITGAPPVGGRWSTCPCSRAC
jgi:crotonobetainyl-CoA:carnitine CoA-transferase CaiB-like acyl-CoA transferase